jgi:hypothetical protein
MKEAEVQLRNLADHISHIQTATYEVAQRGKFKLHQIQKSCENVMNLHSSLLRMFGFFATST